VFLLITAMAANFYRYIVALPLMAVLFGIKATDRVKSSPLYSITHTDLCDT
jgi:hypothetical protein